MKIKDKLFDDCTKRTFKYLQAFLGLDFGGEQIEKLNSAGAEQ